MATQHESGGTDECACVRAKDRAVGEDGECLLVQRDFAGRGNSQLGDDFARILRYQQDWRGGTIITADCWFPSSKRCSKCRTVNAGLVLADREFVCGCGFRADRDPNTAINLAAWPTIDRDVPRSPDT